ncbi:MAG TPA: DUF2442 domain-containing protein [Salinimicrobium sp.]|nr:DUF2442 domain-containing protein [Salinimicrobium sp.]
MNKVIEIEVLNDYRIKLKFNGGEEKIINFKPYLKRGFARELLDPEKFKKVFIEPGGGIAWENGYDFCPNYLKGLTGEEKQIA